MAISNYNIRKWTEFCGGYGNTTNCENGNDWFSIEAEEFVFLIGLYLRQELIKYFLKLLKCIQVY